MAKKKKKSEERKARREAEKAERQAMELAAVELAAKRRRALIIIPVLTIAAACGAWFGLEDRRLVGMSILIGSLVFLLFASGALGATVKPRDRHRSGAIDFGGRKD